MSLLLDALRKSEDQRRKGQLPALDQPLSGSPAAASARSSPGLRIWLTALLIVIVLALALVWWLNRALNDESGFTLHAVNEVAHSTAAAPAEMPLERTRTAAPAPVTQRVAAAPEPSSAAADRSMPAASGPAEVERAPPQDPPAATDPTVADPVSADAAPSATVRTQPQPEPGTEPESIAIEPPLSESEPILQNPTESDQTARMSANESASPAAPAESSVPGFIYAWELPLEARQDFPDLDVAVHVFAPDPANRFVLINGERYAEGDRLAPGVVLDEITREGALVNFRNYRILLR